MTLRRCIKRAIVSLALGVIATIGTSWCIELTSDPNSASVRYGNWHFLDPVTREEGHASEIVTFGRRIVMVAYGQLMIGYPYDHDGPSPSWLPSALKPEGLWGQVHTGWPFYAFKSRTSPEGDRPMFPMWTPECSGQRFYLPIVPMWRGFLLDVVFYAVVSIALPAGFAATRRRHRPGLCAKCRYNLRGLPARTPCPECGTSPAPSQ